LRPFSIQCHRGEKSPKRTRACGPGLPTLPREGATTSPLDTTPRRGDYRSSMLLRLGLRTFPPRAFIWSPALPAGEWLVASLTRLFLFSAVLRPFSCQCHRGEKSPQKTRACGPGLSTLPHQGATTDPVDPPAWGFQVPSTLLTGVRYRSPRPRSRDPTLREGDDRSHRPPCQGMLRVACRSPRPRPFPLWEVSAEKQQGAYVQVFLTPFTILAVSHRLRSPPQNIESLHPSN